MSIQYLQFLNECMLEFVRKILTKIQTENLYSNQLIYISYRTDDENVILSEKVKQTYPREITIVLQNQFEELSVKNEGFSLKVSFYGVKEHIYIPFKALISFSDSNNGYSFKFNRQLNNNIAKEQLQIKSQTTEIEALAALSSPNVIVLDKFRKPKNPTS